MGKFRRYWDIKNITDIFKIPLGTIEAYQILRKEKPALVFAKGGYVSVPVVFAARLLKIPVWLHESDITPGLATKLCSRFAQKIFLSFKESKKFFSHTNVEVVGNPIRLSLLNGSREIGFKLTGFSLDRPVLLVIGGSSGAQSLNKLIEKILPQLLKEANVVHITGPSLNPQPSTLNPHHYKSFPFLNEDLAHIYAIADLVVSRAGSGSIFELLALHKSMILIPLPRSASRGDQIENAKIFEKHGWALVCDQEKTSPQEFQEKIHTLLQDEKARSHMINEQKKAFGYVGAAEKIAKPIMNFTG